MKGIFTYIGELAFFTKDFFRVLPRFYRYFNLIIEQIVTIGVASLPIVLITSFSSGSVTAHQAMFQGKDFIPDIYVGMSVIKAFMIELGPMLTALVVGGRCGSSIAAEIGSMRITEQIDALETLAIDPMSYLVVPRVIAATIALPLLTVVSEVIACIGGGVYAVCLQNIKLMVYLDGLRFQFMVHELWGGLIKAVAFGVIIGFMGCYHGFRASGGTEGVGKATTRGVVDIFILILIFDFIIAQIVF